MIENEDVRPAMEAMKATAYRGACMGTGKIPVRNEDGKDVCPDCGTLIEPVVVRLPAKAKR